MAVRRLGTLLAVLVLAGCSHSISGTYQAVAPDGVAGLHLTENQSQQLLGSMSIVSVADSGNLVRKDVSITGGSTDGHTITLTVKADEPFSEPRNVTGTVAGSGIDLTIRDNIVHYAPVSPERFTHEISVLETTASAKRASLAMARQTTKDSDTVAVLTRDLDSYNTRWANPAGVNKAKSAEAAVLVAARKDLEIKKQLDADHKSFQAGQVAFRIGQLDFQMGQIKLQVDEAIDTGNSHLTEFDKRIAASPCNATPNLQGCKALANQQQRYGAIRARLQGDSAQMQADIRENSSAMDALNKAAGN